VGPDHGTRQDAKEATRSALIAAALIEFESKGFDVPSLDAICARAGYTRGAFYVHFKSRDELVAAAMEHSMQSYLDEVIADGQGEGELEATVLQFVRTTLIPEPGQTDLPGPAFHQIFEASRRSEAVRETFVGSLRQAVERVASAAASGQGIGRVRADIDAERIGELLVLLALGARMAREIGLLTDLEPSRRAALALFLGQE
jgi:AcrR family transcriptional regulator